MPTGYYDRFPGLNDGLAYDERRCSECREVKERAAYSPDRRNRADGLQSICKVCRKARQKAWRDANPEEAAKRARENYLRHRAKKDAYGLEWRKKNRRRVAAYAIKARYGLTQKEWQAIIDAQGNACAICRKPFDPNAKTAPHTDHSHATGRPRGVLCTTCNIGLGHIERPGYLDAALAYLERHSSPVHSLRAAG